MSDARSAEFEAWRQLSVTPFGAVPTFAPMTGGTVPTLSPNYEDLANSSPGASTSALSSGATLALRADPTSTVAPWIGLGACLLLALTGVGIVVLIGYLVWFIPHIRKSGRQVAPCPRCGHRLSVANGAADVQCPSCSMRSSVSWGR